MGTPTRVRFDSEGELLGRAVNIAFSEQRLAVIGMNLGQAGGIQREAVICVEDGFVFGNGAVRITGLQQRVGQADLSIASVGLQLERPLVIVDGVPQIPQMVFGLAQGEVHVIIVGIERVGGEQFQPSVSVVAALQERDAVVLVLQKFFAPRCRTVVEPPPECAAKNTGQQ